MLFVCTDQRILPVPAVCVSVQSPAPPDQEQIRHCQIQCQTLTARQIKLICH